MSFSRRASLLISFFVITVTAFSQVHPEMLQQMKWRGIGPLRGGRTKAISGVPSQPSVFYIGVSNGGVWKTDDYGRTWKPIFDTQPTGSIGSIAVALSDPNVVYVGSGEGLHRPDLSVGDGIYKSTDAGKTWTHLGLRDGQQIPQVAIDPRNADHILAQVHLGRSGIGRTSSTQSVILRRALIAIGRRRLLVSTLNLRSTRFSHA